MRDYYLLFTFYFSMIIETYTADILILTLDVFYQ